MDLGRRLDQVLQVRARKEVAQVDEFAVVFVLDCAVLFDEVSRVVPSIYSPLGGGGILIRSRQERDKVGTYR